MAPGPYWPRTTDFHTVSELNGRIDCKILIFSLRTEVASKRAGASIATSDVSCSTWLWIMSRNAPADS